jgi:hypothetical protein
VLDDGAGSRIGSPARAATCSSSTSSARTPRAVGGGEAGVVGKWLVGRVSGDFRGTGRHAHHRAVSGVPTLPGPDPTRTA